MVGYADCAFAIAQLSLGLLPVAAGLVFLVHFFLLQLVQLFPIQFVDFGQFALELFEEVGTLKLGFIVDFLVFGVVEYGRLGLGCGFRDAIIFYYVALKLLAFLDNEYFTRHAGGGVFEVCLFSFTLEGVFLIACFHIYACIVRPGVIDWKN